MNLTSPHLSLLKNHIDITHVPFSDRGSRLLVYRVSGENHLLVKLAERLIGLDPDIEAYLHRPPFIRDLYLIDEAGEMLEFEITTYPDRIILHTRLGDFYLVFQDGWTLTFGLPPNKLLGVHFHVIPQFWQRTTQGGSFKSVRNVSYNSNTQVASNQITPEPGGFSVDFLVNSADDSAISITIHSSLSLSSETLPLSVSLANSQARWHEWFSKVPPVSDAYLSTYTYAWWVMANNLISPQGNVIFEAMTPSKITYIGLWNWDNAMHSIAYRHINPEIARNQIRALLAYQLPNGMLPDAVYDEGIVSSIDHPIVGDVTKPPILAWAALKLHEMDPDYNFLQEIYVRLMRLNAWWFTMNDDDGDGLAQYNHPYSSGLDDSPLWDYGMPVESPDLNTYLCIQMKSLARIADLLGMSAEATMWRRRMTAIVQRMIKDFWDEEVGLFWALMDEKPIRVVTPFNLYPLWTGQLSDQMNQRLIGHLTNPNEFWGEYVIPTVARNDPHYNPQRMWRGPIWANINYFFIEALYEVGEPHLARVIRDKTLSLMMNKPDIYEYYNAETGEPPPTAANIFGWSASFFIDLAIQASQEDELETDKRKNEEVNFTRTTSTS